MFDDPESLGAEDEKRVRWWDQGYNDAKVGIQPILGGEGWEDHDEEYMAGYQSWQNMNRKAG